MAAVTIYVQCSDGSKVPENTAVEVGGDTKYTKGGQVVFGDLKAYKSYKAHSKNCASKEFTAGKEVEIVLTRR